MGIKTINYKTKAHKSTEPSAINKQSLHCDNTNLGPQQVASEETLELLLGSAPCDSSSLIIACTTYQNQTIPQQHFIQIHSIQKIKIQKEINNNKNNKSIPYENHAIVLNRKLAKPYRNPERSKKTKKQWLK